MPDWKAVLGAVAPKLAGALGGPFVGTAVAAISKVLLGHAGGTEAEIEFALSNATPDQLLLLKQEDNNFALAMTEIYAGNTADARMLARIKGMWPQLVLSVIYTFGYFAVFAFLLGNDLVTLDDPRGDLITILMGALTAAQIQIMNFWFGSSMGSKTK
jgi:hypothetical protein